MAQHVELILRVSLIDNWEMADAMVEAIEKTLKEFEYAKFTTKAWTEDNIGQHEVNFLPETSF